MVTIALLSPHHLISIHSPSVEVSPVCRFRARGVSLDGYLLPTLDEHPFLHISLRLLVLTFSSALSDELFMYHGHSSTHK